MTNLDPQPKKRTVLGEDGELKEQIDLPVPGQTSIFCTQCGAGNSADANFCWKCGKSLSAPVAGSTATQAMPKRKVKNDELFEEGYYEDVEDEVEPNDAEQYGQDWRSMREAARHAKAEAKRMRRDARREARAEMLAAPFEGLSAGGLSAALSLVTLICVAGMTISSLVLHGGNNSWISIMVFVSWFLVEGARRALHRVMTAPAFLVEFFTTLLVSGMVTTSLVMSGGNNTWLSIPILVFWFLVTGARAALKRTETAATAVTDIGISAMVTALVSSSLIFSGGNNAWISIPILVGWLLVTGARKALGQGE